MTPGEVRSLLASALQPLREAGLGLGALAYKWPQLPETLRPLLGGELSKHFDQGATSIRNELDWIPLGGAGLAVLRVLQAAVVPPTTLEPLTVPEQAYYHVQAHPAASDEYAVENDLSLETLRDRVVTPYQEGRTFLVDGVPCHGELRDFKRLKITKTLQPLAHYSAQWNAEQANSGVIFLSHDTRTIPIERGEDVTYSLLMKPSPKEKELSVERTAEPSKEVFIVHGHDELLREKVARFLTSLGCVPFILQEQANAGKTLLEKFEANAIRCGYAVVLLTGDDEAQKVGGAELRTRARQNVVFEFGYFAGAKGRHKVAALVKGDIEIPTDLQGFVYINVEREDWRRKLAKELKSAGVPVNLDALLEI